MVPVDLLMQTSHKIVMKHLIKTNCKELRAVQDITETIILGLVCLFEETVEMHLTSQGINYSLVHLFWAAY